MEEKSINEKESLEIISKMIQSSKDRMQVGSGNNFLYFGYFCTLLGVAIYALSALTQNNMWSAAWFLVFVFWLVLSLLQRNKKPEVQTYTDKVCGNVWKIMGFMFILTFIVLVVMQIIFYRESTATFLMMPLSIIYVGIGVSITGIIVQEKSMQYFPMVAFCIAFYMLAAPYMHFHVTIICHLLAAFSFGFMMIIPGHILNYKAKKQ